MGAEVEELAGFPGSDRADSLLESAAAQDLPPQLLDLIEEYEELSESRPRFMWRWVHTLAPEFTLPFVPESKREEIHRIKTTATLFITLLDDLLEKEGDRVTYEEAAKVPLSHYATDFNREGIRSEHLRMTSRVWDVIRQTLDGTPRSEELWTVFEFDLKQAMAAIEYSYFVNTNPALATYDELVLYDSNNMMHFPYSDIDLMYVDSFPDETLSTLRRTVFQAQRMARIGNWIMTWERELNEGDISSGVVLCALENDVITIEDIKRAKVEDDPDAWQRIIDQINDADVEHQLLVQWRQHHDTLVEMTDQFDSIDITPYVDGTETILRHHLAAKGQL